MKEVSLFCNKKYIVGPIDRRVYGSFAEHMGRVIYTGIYEPEHPLSNADGFRTDVLRLIKDMGISCVRYPGGNFVSAYDWLAGIGPKETRMPRLDPAWRSIETNQFGTNEFVEWAKTAGVEPVFTVNLGTQSLENAATLVEYCNHEGGDVMVICENPTVMKNHIISRCGAWGTRWTATGSSAIKRLLNMEILQERPQK